MEINPELKNIIRSYNDCIKNIMYINEMMCPTMHIKKSSEEEVVDPPEENSVCHECQMHELGITLLRSIKANYSGIPQAISTERPKDIKPEELIEVMTLQAKQRDDLNRGLMEEIATLSQQNTKMMAEITNHLTEIVNLKKNIVLMKNNRCFNNLEELPF